MFDPESISLIIGSAAGVWAVGFTFGKATAWLREIKNAA